MATHELPHMTEAELEAFLADHTSELGLTPQDAECFRIRRRRRSLEMQHNENHPSMVPTSSGSPSRSQSMMMMNGNFNEYNISRNVSVMPGGGNQNQNQQQAPLGSGPFRFVKATLLGDDTEGKMELASMFYTFGDAPVANPRPDLARRPISSSVVDVQSRTLSVATPVRDATGQTVNSTAVWRCELWMPENDNVNRELRTEALNGSHAIVVTFSTKDRKSFDAAASIWLPEAIRYARNAGSKGNGCEVPIILVGTNAEVRKNDDQQQQQQDDQQSSAQKRSAQASTIVTATEAIQLAQDSGAAKYVEVYSGNSFHVRELFVQVVQAAVGARVIAGVPDHFLWKRHRMHCKVYDEYFRAPKPEGYFHSWTGQFILTNFEGSGGGNDLGENNIYNKNTSCEAFGTLDGSDPAFSETAFAIRGPLDLVRGKLQNMIREYYASGMKNNSNLRGGEAQPPALRIVMKRRGYFNSHSSTFPLPKTTPNPHGYVDVSSKMLNLFVRASPHFLGVSSSSRSGNQNSIVDEFGNNNNSGGDNGGDFLALSQLTPWEQSGWNNNNFDQNNYNNNATYEDELQKFLSVVEIRYTLDGSEPNENSPVFVAPVSLDVGGNNDGSRQVNFLNYNNKNTNSNNSNGRNGSDPMTPWSTKGTHPPKEVRAVAIAAGCFRSESVKIDIPDVLPAPRCTFNPTDNTFKIEGGTTTPGVEFRYTTDGSTPCGHSALYTRPISIRRNGEGAVQQVRVAAFPKLALPSVAVTVNISGGGSSSASNRQPGGYHAHHAEGGDFHNHQRSGSNASSSSGAYGDLPRVPTPSASDAPVQMNRAALLLAAHSRQQRDASASASSHPSVAPGSRTASATPRDRFTQPRSGSASSTTNRGPPASAKPPKGTPNLMKNHQNANKEGEYNNWDNESSSNIVPFDFPKPIKLFYLTATTPGEGNGPQYFRILVKTEDQPQQFNVVAEGNLEDYGGIQTLPLPADSRNLRITNVRCEFGDVPVREGEGPPSDSKFQLLDLKVHGNPW